MSLRFPSSSATVCAFSLVVAFVGNASMAWGQFKDLDQPATDIQPPVLQKEASPEQTFVEPDIFLEPQVEPSTELVSVVKAKETGGHDASPKPEPIPMPELAKATSAKTTKKKSESITANEPTPAVAEPSPPASEKPTTPAKSAAEESTSTTPAKPLEVFSSSATDGKDVEIETARFRGMQPGVSTKADLLKEWGQPAATLEQESGSTLVYRAPLFKQIDVEINEQDIVSVIIVHFEKPMKVEDVSAELGLEAIQPVPIPDQYGEILGQAFPERGLLLSFTENIQALRISTILLEPVAGETFRLRAQYDFGHHYEHALADLERAIELDPDDADAHWLRAQFLDAVGRTREAMQAVQKSIRLAPTNPLYRLTRARLYSKTNRLRTGIDEVQEVIRELDLPPEIEGRAQNLLGDMYAIGSKADHQKAMQHHLKAIDAAVKAVSDQRFAVRRAAKYVLVNAHVSVARDIAMGNFQRQSQVVPKWLLRATEMADEFISDDQGDELLQMQIFRDTLASYAELKSGNFDAAVAVDEALKTGRKMIADASDHYYKIQIERMLAESLYHAAKIHRTRGRYDDAMKFANNALGLLDSSDEEWELAAHDHYLEGQLLFLVGSIYAVRDQNHFEAVEYYAKARRKFANSTGYTTPLYSNRNHGEMYVSMGLSYWEADDREEAMRLTLQGATVMKDAVENGTLKLEAMAVPYGNLATMHGQIGNSSKSQEFAKLVAKIDEIGKKTR